MPQYLVNTPGPQLTIRAKNLDAAMQIAADQVPEPGRNQERRVSIVTDEIGPRGYIHNVNVHTQKPYTGCVVYPLADQVKRHPRHAAGGAKGRTFGPRRQVTA